MPGQGTRVGHWPALLPALLLCLLTLSGTATADDLAEQLERLETSVLRDPWQAIQTLDSLAPALDGAPPVLRLRYHLHRAHALLWLYHQEQLVAALDAARALVDEQTSTRERLFLQILEGIAVRRGAEYERSQAILQLTSEAASDAGDREMLVMALTELAFTRSLNGHHEVALVQLQEAWTEASRLDSAFLTATVEETMGAVYGYIDEYETSIEHYQKALATYRNLGYRAHQAEAVNGMGITYRFAEQWDEAIASFHYYRQLTEFNASEHNRFVSWYGLGMTHAERGDCDAALPAIRQALDAGGPEDFRAELYKRRAVCLAERGEAAQAREALRQAQDIFAAVPELRGSRWEIDVKRAEALTQYNLGDHQAAFQSLLNYHEQHTELLSKENSERLMELRVGMENARKDMEIDLLRQQARVDALELAQRDQRLREQRILSGAMLALFAMVILVVVLQWRNARRLRRLSVRDDLTGLFNRRHLFTLLERLIRRLPAERGQLSVILLDVDDFKQINDRYGHPVGDSLLKAIADLTLPLLRSGDNMARLGGEEFLVVLPRTDSSQACGVARRLVERIRHFSLPLADGREARVTVSIGVASFGPGCDDVDSLYSAADRALYAAKSRGKDRVMLARPDGDCLDPVY